MRGCWKWPGFSSILAFQGEEEQKVEKKGRNKLRGDFGLRRMLLAGETLLLPTPLLVS